MAHHQLVHQQAHQLYTFIINDNYQDWYGMFVRMKDKLLEIVTPVGTNTILHVAAEYKRTSIVQKILEEFNPQNNIAVENVRPAQLLLYKQNSNGDTALHVAARVGCLDIIEKLINADHDYPIHQDEEAGILPITKMINLEGDNVLHIAVRYGDLDVINFLLQNDFELVTQQNKAGESALFQAIERGSKKIAIHILYGRSDYAYGGREGMNALHAAIVLEGTTERSYDEIIYDICNKHPSTAFEKDNILKWTPLHCAAYYNIVNNFLLVKYEIDTNNTALEVDKNGMSALHIAAANGNAWILVELIKRFPLLYEVLNKLDQTALHVAIESGQESIVVALIDQKRLNSSEIFLNKQDKDGNTALHLAAIWGETGILRRLLNIKEVKGNIANKKGLTIFDILVKQQGATLEDSMFLMKFTSWMKVMKLPISVEQRSSIMSMLRKRKKENKIRGLEGQVAQIEAEIQFYKESQDEKQKVDQDKKSDKVLEDEKGDPDANRSDLVRKREEVRRNNYKVILTKKSSYYLLWELVKSILDMITNYKMVKKTTENDMLIATIIATVTFAVAFQVPGGYESEGQHKGLPILRSRYSFTVFIISNSMAFGFSSCSILLHFLAAKGQSAQQRDRLLRRGMVSTLYSMLTMVAAFISAIQLISTNSKALQEAPTNSKTLQAAPYVCASSFIFFVAYDVIFHYLRQLSLICLGFGIIVLYCLLILPLLCLLVPFAIILDRYLHHDSLKEFINEFLPFNVP